MKNLLHIESPAPKHYKFTHADLEKAMLDGCAPSVVLCPFRDSYNYKLKKVKLSVSLISNSNDKPLNILSKSFGCKSNELINKVSFWIAGAIWKEFKLATEEWSKFVQDNAEEFCKKNLSRSKWTLFCNTSKPLQKDLLDEQKLWILYNSMLDKEDNIKLIEAVRESIVPWINPQLWRDIEKQKKNEHQNVAYEKQKKAMVESNMNLPNDLDIIM